MTLIPRLVMASSTASLLVLAAGGADHTAFVVEASVSAERAVSDVPEAPDVSDVPDMPDEAPADAVKEAPEPTSDEKKSPAAEPAPAPTEYDFSALSPVVQAFVDANHLNGAGLIVVHRDDGVIHQDHWGEFDADRVSLIASSSKMITAGVLMRLDDEGLLDIDAPVADVVDWGSAHPDITPAQLISNSSGLVGLFPNPRYGPYECQFMAADTLQSCAETIFTTSDDDNDIVPPDSQYRYGGGQWQVAGAVAEAASGKSWAELIDDTYVEPCDLDTLAFNNHFSQFPGQLFGYPTSFSADPSRLAATDNPNMEAGAYVTTGDYGALLLMHLRGGMCGDDQVLSNEAVDRMHTDRIGDAYGGDIWNPGLGYGLGWCIEIDSGRLIDAGAFGSVPWLDPEDGYGAYLVVEADNVIGAALAEQLYELVDRAIAGS